MTTLDIRNASGEAAGSVELPAEIFDVQANIPLMHQVVVAQLAAARQGTHATKTRGDVRGGGKKPYRQKGTGRARQGSSRAAHMRGGGVVHGPRHRRRQGPAAHQGRSSRPQGRRRAGQDRSQARCEGGLTP